MGLALIPLSTTLIMYFVLQSKRYAKVDDKKKQIAVGIIFGIIAIIATEFGVQYNSTIINVRDAAPLCAGLFFGPWAGIISGIIGGVERWFCVYWGGGYYTRVACTISTIVVGFIAAYFRKHIFAGRNPEWFLATFIGFFSETFHMIMIFMTNLDYVKVAFDYVQTCSGPMITLNSLAVGLAAFFIHRIEKESLNKKVIPTISSQYQSSLIIVVVVGFVITAATSYTIERQISLIDSFNETIDSIIEVYVDGTGGHDEKMYSMSKEIADDFYHDLNYDLNWLADYYDVKDIIIFDKEANALEATVKGYVGRNAIDIKGLRPVHDIIVDPDENVSREFSILLTKTADGNQKKFAGIAYEDKFVVISFSKQRYDNDLDHAMELAINNHRVGEWGSLMVVNEDGTIVSDKYGLADRNVKDLGLETVEPDFQTYSRYEINIDGEPYYYTLVNVDTYKIYAFYQKAEADFVKNQSTMMNTFMQTMVFGLLFVCIYYITKRLIVNNIDRVNSSLDKITKGDLETVVDVKNNMEFISLSTGINSTVDSLKHFIKEANERIDSELKYAKEIQFSSLQTEFPAFPDHDEFDLYAIMDPAKVVGGDFYDFYMIDDESLIFLVADVSGKSIPASLFMMRAKTMIRNYVETQISLGEVLTKANSRLCEGNDAGMFVTTWIGDLDLKTGELRYANAGHNLPLLKRKDGEFEYLKVPAGFVLAGMDGIKYKEQSLTIEPGDELFVYSDGVVEATNVNNELYGDDRLKACLNNHPGETAQQLCESVLEDVNRFYEGAEQFDDITELSLKFFKYSK